MARPTTGHDDDTARRRAARRRRGGDRDARRSPQRRAAPRRDGLRAEPRGRRGGRAGDVDRGHARDRRLRGPLVAEDVDLPDPHQLGAAGRRRASAAACRSRRSPRAEDTGEPSVDPDRFLPADHELFPGHWVIMPARWPTPEEGLLAGETREVIAAAIAELPEAQRTVHRAARHRGLELRGGLRGARDLRRQPAHPAPPGAQSRVRAAIEDYYGAVEEIDYDAVTAELRGDTAGETPMTDARTPADDLACIEEVELITDYLEGALPAPSGAGSSAPRDLPRLHRVPRRRCGRVAGSLGGLRRGARSRASCATR